MRLLYTLTAAAVRPAYARCTRSTRSTNNGAILEVSCMSIGMVSRYSPTRSRSSHWRNSPLKPMLSAIWKLEMTYTARFVCRIFQAARRSLCQ